MSGKTGKFTFVSDHNERLLGWQPRVTGSMYCSSNVVVWALNRLVSCLPGVIIPITSHITPLQIFKSVYIQRGCLWGCSIYFNPIGGRPGIISPRGVDIDPSDFPADWFEGLEDDMYKARRYIAERNKYKVGSVMTQLCVMMNSHMCRGCVPTVKRVLDPDVHLAPANARCAHTA